MSDQTSGAGAPFPPFVLGIVGDSGSGKRTVCQGVGSLIGPGRVAILELDDYHRFTRAERLEKGLTALNPQVHDLKLMQEHVGLFRRGRPVRNRSYEHADGTFGPIRTLEPREVVIARGLLGFPTDELKRAYDLAVFLQPEPELLFRWKLRRDVKTRGYTEAEVLKHIAQHLLDAKQFVLPQADRADLVVHYEVPEWDAPDAQLTARLVVRGPAAGIVRDDGGLSRFGAHLEREDAPGGGMELRVSSEIGVDAVDAWAGELFPETYRAESAGLYMDAEGEWSRLPQLAFAQVMIASLTERLRAGAAHGAGAAA